MAYHEVEEWLEPDGLLLIESWARDGYVVDDIATRIGVHPSTMRGWMKKYPEIRKAVNNGRELVDYKVENALLKAALGYKTREVSVTAIIKNGKVVREEKQTLDKEFAPNVQACRTWLFNRKPSNWKPESARGASLMDLDEDTSIHITVERAGAGEIKDGAYEGGSSTFEEVDTDWQNDVNKSITIRKATELEKSSQDQKVGAVKKSQTGVRSNSGGVQQHTDSDANDDDWGDDVYRG